MFNKKFMTKVTAATIAVVLLASSSLTVAVDAAKPFTANTGPLTTQLINKPYVVIDLNDNINTSSVALVRNGIAQAKAEHKDLLIQINSYGGQVNAMFQIINMMNHSGITIDTYAYGFAASAAAVILMSGKHRFISPEAVVLTHYGSMGNAPIGTVELENAAGLFTALNQSDEIYFSYKTGHTVEEVRQIFLVAGRDKSFNSQQAVSVRLVDSIEMVLPRAVGVNVVSQTNVR